MKELEHLVYRARRQLWLNRWLALLGWTTTGAAAVFVAVVIVQRLWMFSDSPAGLFVVLAPGLAVGACLGACLWTVMTREGMEAAAARLDEAAGLKERVSTALYCASPQAVEHADPFAQAVRVDAEHVVGGVVPRDCLPIRWPDSARFAGGSVLAALLVLWLFPNIDLAGLTQRREREQQREEVVQRTAAEVRPMLVKTYEDVARKVPAMADELTKTDPLENARLDTPLDVRRAAIKKVDQLADQLQRRRDSGEMGRVDEFKKMMRRLASEATQPTEVGKLAGALAKGDLASARAAVAELRKKLSEAPRTPEEKQQADALKDQLKKLSDKLADMAEKDQKLADKLKAAGLNPEELKKAMELLKKQDLDALAKQLANKGLSEEQIRQMMQQMKSRCGACEAARRLAQGLGAAGSGKAMSSGQAGASAGTSAMAGLSMADEQLSEMESLQQEMAELNSAMAELDNTRTRLGTSCKMCNGTGMCNGKPCGTCLGRGLGMGPNPGQGQGNVAPEEQTAFNMVERRTPVKTGRGSIISQRFIDGEQYKGEVSLEFAEAALSAERDVTDAIARERIPRLYHTPVKKYFTRFRESLPTEQDTPGDADK